MSRKSFLMLPVLMLAACLAFVGCGSLGGTVATGTADAGGRANPTVTIVNNTGYTVWYVYMSASTDTNWGDDLLADDQILNNGESVSIELPHPLSVTSRYDIRLRDSDGDDYIKMNVTVSANSRIEFTFDDLDVNRFNERMSGNSAQDSSTVYNGPPVVIVNNTGVTIWYVYIGEAATNTWGADRLGADQILNNGDTVTLNLPRPLNETNRYNVRLRDSANNDFIKNNIQVTANGRIVFTAADRR
jgi:ribosomal protein S17